MTLKSLSICFLIALLGNNVTAQTPLPDKTPAGEIRMDTATLSRLAATLGASLANKAARRKFDAEPFVADAAQAVLHDGRWEWQATAGHGKGDLRATVSFGQDGSEPKAEIAWMVDMVDENNF